MPNKEKHALIGGLAALFGYVAIKRLLNEEPVPKTALGCGIAGAGIGTLPDELDPPTNPKHRHFAHSATMGGTVIASTWKMMDNTEITNEQKAILGSLAVAYLSHLIFDSDTPAGIPPI